MSIVSGESASFSRTSSQLLRSETAALEGTRDLSHEQQLAQLLNSVYSVLAAPGAEASAVQSAVDQLFGGLQAIREVASKEQWQQFIKVGRAHPVCPLIHQDPFTSRAFYKPRGYAGDAVMMDYIYGREENWQRPPASDLGDAIFRYTTAAPASAGVRERRCFIAELLDQIARQRTNQHVLCVAAGHLREASLSSAIRRGRFSRFLALDADARSLEEIRAKYGHFGIEPIAADVRRMLTGRLDLGTFDLIYSTGLYDYLADSTAKRLTANLFDRVRPGGRLVIANFLPQVRDIGYMEMYMDWHLIYRTRGQMLMLADQIVQSSIEEVRVTAESNENVVVMEMVKR
jgi:SAM-dependent methyltransferase